MLRINGFVLLLLIAILCIPLLTLSVWQMTRLLDLGARRANAAVNRAEGSLIYIFDGFLCSVKAESVQRVNDEYVMSNFEPRHVAEARVMDGGVVGLVLDDVWDRPDLPLL